jgi:mannose-6-phosphate isomerase-like protein (cupin superfamily)
MRSPALPLIAILGVTAAVIATVVLLPAQHTASGGSAKPHPEVAKPATPMILQEADGDQLVHRAGPLRGLPFTIKVDGQVGNSEDFFVFAETLAPGQTIPFHKHENAEELLIFQEPGASVIVGDKAGVAGPQSIVFIPCDTWISATNTSGKDLHTLAIFSRHGFESYMRAIAVKAGQPLTPLTQEELTRLRTAGHAVYWDSAKGPYPPGVAHH